MTRDGIKERARLRADGASPFRVGRYEIVTRIGNGGMATVHLARSLGSIREDPRFERLVAVKVLHPHLAEDRGFVEMFMHEARVAANIRHPNVVTILDVGEEDGLLYNVMDYIEGDTLAAVQATASALGKGVPLPIVLRMAVDVLSGLHAAHELRDDQGELLNVVHRDVTPQNILIGVDGTARLTDFGIARARGRIMETSHGMLKGKLAYMPPEQLEASELDRRADVFSMGVTLWETLALRRLFPRRATFEQARKDARAPYRPLGEFHKALPPVLDEICARALAHDPDARFPTAAAFADAIEQRLGASLASTREVGTFIAAVARDKLEREREALRATSRRNNTPPRAEEAPSPLEASVLEPIPLVPQRRRAPPERTPTLPPEGFFPHARLDLDPHDESVTRELPLEPRSRKLEPPMPVRPSLPVRASIEVVDDRVPVVEASLEPVRWTPLQAPPVEAAPRTAWPRVMLVAAALVFLIVLAALLRRFR